MAKRTNSYQSCDWKDLNGDGWFQDDELICETITETYDAAEIRMVFQDGTKADLETYTNTGFENLEKEFEKFVDSL